MSKKDPQDPKFSKEKSKHKLYEYQEDAVDALEEAVLDEGIELSLVQIPTGGGKTRTINEFLYRNYINKNKKVLWVATKSWELLKQASGDLIERYKCAPKRLGRIGGTEEVKFLEDGYDHQVLYTTIHTFYARTDEIIANFKPDIVVIDELDLGEEKKMWSSLVDEYEGVCPIIGLTATPLEQTRFKMVFTTSFPELVESGFLASIEAFRVRTGKDREPKFVNKLLTQGSLEELTDYRRNCIVANTYNPEDHGKTLVFAVNKAHAAALAKTFNDRFKGEGLDRVADYIVCDVDEKRQIFEDFKASNIDVLINVEMITRGVDVPDIESIFMARPTESDRLFIQMVGRGARKTPGSGKESFKLVEFTDNIINHGEYFVNYETYFGKAPQEINYMFAEDQEAIKSEKSYFDTLMFALEEYLNTEELRKLCQSLNGSDRIDNFIDVNRKRAHLLDEIKKYFFISEIIFALVECNLLQCENLDGHFYMDKVVREYGETREELNKYMVEDLARLLKYLNVQFPPLNVPIGDEIRKNDMIDLIMTKPQEMVRNAMEELFALRPAEV